MAANPLSVALAAGDPQAYAALYDRLGPRLYRVALVLLRDRQEAEDAVQDVFVRLVRWRDRLAKIQDPEAYVFVILRNLARQRAARVAAERKRLHTFAQNSTPDANSIDLSDDRLDRALQTLPAEQREMIALKIDADLTFSQIGGVLKISPNTAASRYRYALDKLRRAMEQSP